MLILYCSIPGYDDFGEDFEEGMSGWCVLTADAWIAGGEEKVYKIETLAGGVGETHIKFKINIMDSGHGPEEDPVQIIVWGH